MPQVGLPGVVLALSVAAASCAGSSAPEPASPVAASKPLPTTIHFSEGGCSVDLPGAWKRLPTTKESGGFWEVETEDGRQTVSVLPMPIPKPSPPGEWREDLAAVVNLRRDGDHEAFGPDARFSEPEYHADQSSPSVMYTVHDPAAGVLQVTLVKMVSSRFCLALLREESDEEVAFTSRAKALLDALRVEP